MMEQNEIDGEEKAIIEKIGAPRENIIFIISIISLIISASTLAFVSFKFNRFSEKVANQEKQIEMCSLESFMAERVATDDLVVQRAHFLRSETGLAIDIRPQPVFAQHLLGEGKFALPDRKLKSVLMTLLGETKRVYEKDKIKLPAFKDLKIYITENNYEVATYGNGRLKLKS